MRITPIVALAAVVLVSGCGAASEEPAPATSTSTSTVRVPLALYDQWNPRLDDLAKREVSCAPRDVKSSECVAHLEDVVTLMDELDRTIRARPDHGRYSGTLTAIGETLSARQQFTLCTVDGNTVPVEQCHSEAVKIVTSPSTVGVKLYAEDA